VKARLEACSLALFVVLLATFSGCRAAGSREVHIGGVLPLTGDLAIYGQKMKNGIDLAIKQINAKGGVQGKQIAVLYEDDQGDPKASIAAILKLISVSKVNVIIGGAISATALPSVPVINQHAVVLFSPAATSPKLSGMSKYFFRNWPPDVFDGTAMGDFAAKTLHLKRVAMLYVNNEWGVAISKIFSGVFQANGGTVVETESYEPSATDFRTQLVKIAAAKPEAIYIPGYLKELIIALRQKQELRVGGKVLSAYGFYDPMLLEQAKTAAEGAVFTVPAFDPDNPSSAGREFTANFQTEYGEKPDVWAAQAYDAAEIIAAALKTGATTGPDIRNEIAKTNDFDGVSGRTSFDENGDVQKPLRFMTVRHGEFVNYLP